MNNGIDTAIVTVNYNTGCLIIELIRSLFLELEALGDTRMIIVDNNSTDNSVGVLREFIRVNQINWVELLLSDENLGFAGGNNIAIEHIKSKFKKYEHIWFINPDTQVMPCSGEILRSFLKRENKDLAGSQMFDQSGELHHSSFNFPGILSEFCSGARIKLLERIFSRHLVARKLVSENQKAEWLSGASFMASKKCIDKLTGLDSGYFLYFEEVDFFLKANRSGFECWHVPSSRVMHIVGASTNIKAHQKRRAKYWFDSRRRYFLKNYGAIKLILCDVAFILGYSSWVLRKMIINSPELRKEPIQFLRDFIRNSFLFRGVSLRN